MFDAAKHYDYWSRLVEFLRKHTLRDEFEYELGLYRNIDIFYYIEEEFCRKRRPIEDVICEAFVFGKTRKGNRFWLEVHFKWVKELECSKEPKRTQIQKYLVIKFWRNTMSVESLKNVEKYYLELVDFLDMKEARKSFEYALMVYHQKNIYDYINAYFVGEQAMSFDYAAITHAFPFIDDKRGASFWIDIHHEWVKRKTADSIVKKVLKFNSIW